MSNTNLTNSKQAKNDEFYTMYEDIENELQHYPGAFEGKIVYCNCDSPEWSNFWKYFHINFKKLGLKKLVSTHYETNGHSYKMEYEGGDDNDVEIGIKTPLEGNGDFRNQECIDLLKEADIVVTNPPFSIAREDFIPQLFEHKKKFLIIGDLNWVTYKIIFPLLKNNEMWMGYSAVKEFLQPNGTIKKFGNKLWFTNLDIKKRHEKLILWKNYTPAEFPQYDNYDAINVDKVSNIPCDYCESWEVTKDEFKNFSADEWEVTRTGERDGEKSFFIIPAANIKLRKLLHEHAVGYKEEIESEIFKNIHKNINNDELPKGRRAALGSLVIMPELWAYRLHTLTVITPPSLKSSAWRPETLKGLPVLIQQQEKMDRILEENSNTEEFSSERYCNGIAGVPITFLDKYSPEQFEIVNANDYRKTENVPVKSHGLIKDKEGAVKKNCLRTNLHQKKALNCSRLEAMDGISPENGNMQGFLSDRYCNGVLGVPITYLDKYNPEQFEIIGMLQSSTDEQAGIPNLRFYNSFREMRQDMSYTGASGGKANGNPVIKEKPKKGNFLYNEKTGEYVHSVYARIVIRRKL